MNRYRFIQKNDNININNNKLLSIGRISPVKNIEILIEAVNILLEKDFNFSLNIYGDVLKKDKKYFKKIKKLAINLTENKKIIFNSPIANFQTPKIYNKYNLFINLTTSGSFDKTILEAMACKSLVLVCNKSLGDNFPKNFLFKENNAKDLADKIIKIFSLSNEELKSYSNKFRQYVVDNHSLKLLSNKIKINLKNL